MNTILKFIKKISLFLILVLILGCNKDEEVIENSIPDSPTISDITIPFIVPSGEENYLNESSNYIFDQNQLHTFALEIPSLSLQKINSNPTAEQYVEAMMIFEGDTISPVGVRYKGSIGAFVNCLSGTNWADPSGYKTCTKLSMKVKINWRGREDKFYKLKKLQFHSQNLDPSQMHERLGYWLFREMGVPAPRSVHARLMINGKFSGLYALTEQIDNRFVKYNFDDEEGNLYKEVWPLKMNGSPHDESYFINALETNEDQNPTAEIIRNFGKSIANASPSNAKSVVEETMDIDEVISYAVVDRTIRHDDGPFHWYCSGGYCDNHNYYFYEEPNKLKLHLIPWDLDNAFENIINNANPITPIADEWGAVTNNCQPFSHGSFGFQQWSASCDKLTATWASYDTEYKQKKEQLLNGPMSSSSINEVLELWSNQIENATKEANDIHSDAISVIHWKSEVVKLRSQLEHARNY